MTNEELEQEFIRRADTLIKSEKQKHKQTGMLSAIKEVTSRTGSVYDFSHKLVDLLNSILIEKNFDKSKSSEITTFIRPTVKNLLQEYLRN